MANLTILRKITIIQTLCLAAVASAVPAQLPQNLDPLAPALIDNSTASLLEDQGPWKFPTPDPRFPYLYLSTQGAEQTAAYTAEKIDQLADAFTTLLHSQNPANPLDYFRYHMSGGYGMFIDPQDVTSEGSDKRVPFTNQLAIAMLAGIKQFAEEGKPIEFYNPAYVTDLDSLFEADKVKIRITVFPVADVHPGDVYVHNANWYAPGLPRVPEQIHCPRHIAAEMSLFPTGPGHNASSLTFPGTDLEFWYLDKVNLSAPLTETLYNNNHQFSISPISPGHSLLNIDVYSVLDELFFYSWDNPSVEFHNFTMFDCHNKTLGYGNLSWTTQPSTLNLPSSATSRRRDLEGSFRAAPRGLTPWSSARSRQRN